MLDLRVTEEGERLVATHRGLQSKVGVRRVLTLIASTPATVLLGS